MTLEFVHYRIKIKVGVTLQCKVAMHNKYMSKLPRVSLFNFLSHVFAKYYLNWFTDGKVITKKYQGAQMSQRLYDCRVSQFWPNLTGPQYSADNIGLSSTTMM